MRAICNALAEHKLIGNDPILSMEAQAAGVVVVDTGVVQGLLDARGTTVTLQKKNGVWVVVDVLTWIS